MVSTVLFGTMHDSLDRQHIELLVALQDTGQLGRAADALHLSPSAASHRLKEAERRLGVALTVVDGRSIELTSAGLHLAEIGGVARQLMRSAEETARWMSSADRPAVRVALDFYDTAPWFERLIGSAQLPCDLDFIRIGFADVASAVSSRRVDLGVTVAPLGEATRGPRTLMADELVGVVRADHPAVERGELEPDDVVGATYLTAGDRPSQGFEHHEFFEPAGVRPGRLRKVESLAMILRLMRRFGGLTIQPAVALDFAPLDDLAVLPLAGPSITVQWSVELRADPTENEVAIAEAIESYLHDRDQQAEAELPAWAGR